MRSVRAPLSLAVVAATVATTPTLGSEAAGTGHGRSCATVSTNGAWSRVTLPLNGRSAAVDPANPNLLWVTDQSVVMRSKDGGCTWQKVFDSKAVETAELANPTVTGIATTPPGQRNRTYLGLVSSDGTVYLAESAGTTWLFHQVVDINDESLASRALSRSGRILLAVAPHDSKTVYVATPGSQALPICREANRDQKPPPAACLEAYPKRDPLAGLYVTHDAGLTWNRQDATGMPAGFFRNIVNGVSELEPSSLSVDPVNRSRLLATWVDIDNSNGNQNGPPFHTELSNNSGATFAGGLVTKPGTDDGTTFIYDPPFTSFSERRSGRRTLVRNNAKIFLSPDGRGRWSRVSPPLSHQARGYFETASFVDRNTVVVLAGYRGETYADQPLFTWHQLMLYSTSSHKWTVLEDVPRGQELDNLEFLGSVGTRARTSLAWLVQPWPGSPYILLHKGFKPVRPTHTWTRYMGEMPTPDVARNAALIQDIDRKELVLVGSDSANDNQLETWTWDGREWSKATGPMPTPRSQPQVVYDETRHEIVLFGGTATTYLNDTWVWDGHGWSQRSPATSPPGRTRATIVYDPARLQVLMFGGYANGALADTWTWNGSNWTSHTGEGPQARSDAFAAYDAKRRAVVLVGGSTSATETWTWNGRGWTSQAQEEGPDVPNSRIGYDEAHRQVMLLEFDGSTWIWAGDRWKLAALEGPGSSRALCFNEGLGGLSAYATGEAWIWTGRRWSDFPGYAPGNNYLSELHLAYDPAGKQMLLMANRSFYPNQAEETWLFR